MGFKRPRFDIADIVRLHRAALEASHRLSPLQRRVLTAIGRCRTAALGGHKTVCENGDFEQISYNSCRDRHCPKCQALAQERWLEKESKRLLDMPHFHLVFTVPQELRFLAKLYPAKFYGALFHAVTRTLLKLFRNNLKAIPGLLLVLHTWTRELTFHPHLHVLVTAGGLALDMDPGARTAVPGHSRRMIPSGKKYLFPIKVMGEVFRAKMLNALGTLQKKGAFPELPKEFYAARMATVSRIPWQVHAKKPCNDSSHVIAYLARYIFRVGIANSRILDVRPDGVTFATKDGKSTTVHPVEFLWRLIQHVLPPGFHKIRHAGIYGSLGSGGLLEQARAIVRTRKKPRPGLSNLERMEQASRVCPVCGGALYRTTLPASIRAPPEGEPC